MSLLQKKKARTAQRKANPLSTFGATVVEKTSSLNSPWGDRVAEIATVLTPRALASNIRRELAGAETEQDKTVAAELLNLFSTQYKHSR